MNPLGGLLCANIFEYVKRRANVAESNTLVKYRILLNSMRERNGKIKLKNIYTHSCTIRFREINEHNKIKHRNKSAKWRLELFESIRNFHSETSNLRSINNFSGFPFMLSNGKPIASKFNYAQFDKSDFPGNVVLY